MLLLFPAIRAAAASSSALAGPSATAAASAATSTGPPPAFGHGWLLRRGGPRVRSNGEQTDKSRKHQSIDAIIHIATMQMFRTCSRETPIF